LKFLQSVNPARKYFAKYDVLLFLRHGVQSINMAFNKTNDYVACILTTACLRQCFHNFNHINTLGLLSGKYQQQKYIHF